MNRVTRLVTGNTDSGNTEGGNDDNEQITVEKPALTKPALDLSTIPEYDGTKLYVAVNILIKEAEFSSAVNYAKKLIEMGVDGIDLVCLSMAIMDFKKPFKVLQAIQNCLNEDAVMIIRDIDDGAVFGYPDSNGYFKNMQAFYIHDKYSGYRYTGRQVYSYLKKISPKTICLEKFGINTSNMSRRDKKALFECWFSFIPNDFSRMLREDPDCEIAREVVDFCNEYYDDLNEEFFSSDTIFSSGYVIYTATF